MLLTYQLKINEIFSLHVPRPKFMEQINHIWRLLNKWQ